MGETDDRDPHPNRFRREGTGGPTGLFPRSAMALHRRVSGTGERLSALGGEIHRSNATFHVDLKVLFFHRTVYYHSHFISCLFVESSFLLAQQDENISIMFFLTINHLY
jgi:hypothetical protein